MIEVLKDWIEGLVMDPLLQGEGKYAYNPKFLLPPRIRNIDCMGSMCVFVKCFDDDDRCTTARTDVNLLNYDAKGTNILAAGRKLLKKD